MPNMLVGYGFCVIFIRHMLSVERRRNRSDVCDHGTAERETGDEAGRLCFVGSSKWFPLPVGNANIYCPGFMVTS